MVERIEADVILVDTLDAVVDHPVYTAIDAGMSRLDLPVTVVQTPVVQQAGRVDRWAFRVQATLISFGVSPDDAKFAHLAAADALLEATSSFDGAILFSSLVCDSEPRSETTRPGADWPAWTSTYILYMRSKERS